MGAVLLITAELESRLRALGSLGGGLGTLTQNLPEDALPIDVRARLLALASIRNKAVHQPGSVTGDQIERFLVQAQEMATLLDQLQGEDRVEGENAVATAAPLPVQHGLDSVTGGRTDPVRPPMPKAERLDLSRIDPPRRAPVLPVVLVVCAVLGAAFFAYQKGLVPGTVKAPPTGAAATGWMYSAAVRRDVTLTSSTRAASRMPASTSLATFLLSMDAHSLRCASPKAARNGSTGYAVV